MKKYYLLLLCLLPFWVDGQVITTFAGNGSTSFSGNGVSATAAGIPNPTIGVVDKFGNYYFADNYSSNRIRKIDLTGIITTVVGTGMGTYGGDGGIATNAKLYHPHSVKLDTAGNLYIADMQNYRIRKVDIATGTISTIVGTGTSGFSGDGSAATLANIGAIPDVCLDKFGNLYIGDIDHYIVRKINSSGLITTFAGTANTSGCSGDGGPATAAYLKYPGGLAADDSGNIYIADATCNTVRKVNLFGIISTVAGNGSNVYIGDGMLATAAQIQPEEIAIDYLGLMTISDGYHNRVYSVDASGILHCIAGTGTAAFSGDGGPATAAELSDPGGIALDYCGNVYIPDAHNNRIRKITYPSTPSVSITSPTASAIGSTVTITAGITGGCCASYSYLWMNKGVVFATTTAPTTAYTKTSGIDSITVKAVGCGDTTVSSVHVVLVDKTGTSPSPSKGGVTYYPNPVHAELVVDAGVAIRSVSVVNLLGQVVYFGVCNGEFERGVDVRELPVGVYFVRVVFEDGGVGVERFVKIN